LDFPGGLRHGLSFFGDFLYKTIDFVSFVTFLANEILNSTIFVFFHLKQVLSGKIYPPNQNPDTP